MTGLKDLPRFSARSRCRSARPGRFVGVLGVGVLLAACTPEEDLGVREDIFGTIFLEAHRTANQPSTPFVDTETVTVTVTFGECLTGYYDAHPEWAVDGSKGSHVAEAWLDVLCDRGVYEDVFKCEPTGHEFKPGAGPGGRDQMLVFYDALHPELDNFDIRIGPIAREELAGCEPTVEVGFDAVEGFAGGNLVWEIDPVFTEMGWQGTTQSTVTNSNEAVKFWVRRSE